MGRKKKGEAKSTEDDGKDIPSSNTRSGKSYGSAVDDVSGKSNGSAVDDVKHESDLDLGTSKQAIWFRMWLPTLGAERAKSYSRGLRDLGSVSRREEYLACIFQKQRSSSFQMEMFDKMLAEIRQLGPTARMLASMRAEIRQRAGFDAAMEEDERAVHRQKMLDEIRSMRTDAPSETVTT